MTRPTPDNQVVSEFYSKRTKAGLKPAPTMLKFRFAFFAYFAVNQSRSELCLGTPPRRPQGVCHKPLPKFSSPNYFAPCVLSALIPPSVLILLEIVRLRCRLVRPWQPKRAAQVVGAWRGAGFEHPLFVDLVGLVGVDEDVAVLVVGARFGDSYLLVPAVLAADKIGLHREC